MIPIDLINLERFWNKVDKDGDCWEWTAYKHKDRGMFRVGNRMYNAPRVSYTIANGNFSSNLYVLHTCDNPSCVNPEHLFIGTQDDNMKDMVSKGRQHFHRGIENGRCKTDLETVIEIKKLLKLGKSAANIRDLGYPYRLAAKIKSGENWSHINV